MNRRFMFMALFTILLATLLAGCGPAIVENQAATAAPDLPGEVALATPEPLADSETLVTQLPFDENTLVDLYERANPSVVNIRVVDQPDEGETADDAHPFIPDFPDIPGFPDIPQGQPIPPQPQQGVGSGFVYDKEGHIVTNNHVVASADRIVVTFADGAEADATLVGADPDSDLAVIKIDGDDLAPLPLGDSESLKVGQLVVAIGNPFGLSGSMTTGIISGLGRMLPAGSSTPNGMRFSIPDIIQTDAAINPGNSGGPLLNIKGEVIGVNTAIESPVRSFAGIGYAVPAGTVAEVVPQLIEKGVVEHPWLGIVGGTLTPDLARAMELEDTVDGGVLVREITAGSPADEAGLRGSDTETEIDGFPAQIGGDVIIGVDDLDVKDFDDLLRYIIHETDVGQTITLHVVRDGQEPIEIPVPLAARPTQDQ